ncbi:serine/threonine protein kinase [Saccharomycopsis crataegensis]|uniref:non-specific serine/threonine protein kinase n=1 Tax=Saccharomycopsis crataegensis TaxID=43959 RepID=A0AAV5QTG4_9ASCO|nr:serine/threonine protein kinase [Saccharomycopsis crataegensis]
MSNPSEEWAAKLKVVEKNSDGTTQTRIIRRTSSDFKFERELGEGSYSTVMLAHDIHTEKPYAVKVLDKRHIVKEKKVKYVNIEKESLNILGRRNGIVHLFFTFQDEYSLYFVLDYASNGELLSLIKKYGSLNEEVTKYYTCQLIDALKYIHDSGIIHRDLKPENILLDQDWKIQITDFGTAKFLDKDPSTGAFIDDGRAKSFVGTAEYVSPELLNDKAVGKPCDIWALGCIIFQMIAGKPPFKATNDYLTFQQVMKVKYAFSAGFPSIIRDLVKRILVPIPGDRPTIKEIKKHLFFQDINWKASETSIWYTPPPEFSPYKMSVQSMKPIPALSDNHPKPRMRNNSSRSSPSVPVMDNNGDSKKNLSANAAVIALTKLSLADNVSAHDGKPKRRSSKDHHRQNSAPSSKRGQDLRMKYHDGIANNISTSPRANSPTITSSTTANHWSSSSPAPANGELSEKRSKKGSVSLPSSPLMSSPGTPFASPQLENTTSFQDPRHHMHSSNRKRATPTAVEAAATASSSSSRARSALDVSWGKFLHPKEHILRVGVLYVKYLTTDNFERKFKGKLANSPLYYKGKRMSGSGLPATSNGGASGSYSLLTQMVHGNGRSGLRGDYSNSSISEGSISSGSSNTKKKTDLENLGIVHYVKTPDIEELEGELESNAAAKTVTVNGNHGGGNGMFKKFLSNTKSAMSSSILGSQGNSTLEFNASRMILVTSQGRLLILGKRPGYVKPTDGAAEDNFLKYQALSEIDLTHPSIRFKEVITDATKTNNNVTSPIMESNYGSPNPNNGFERGFYSGIFAVVTYSTTTLFQVDKGKLNDWTECLTESRIGGRI